MYFWLIRTLKGPFRVFNPHQLTWEKKLSAIGQLMTWQPILIVSGLLSISVKPSIFSPLQFSPFFSLLYNLLAASKLTLAPFVVCISVPSLVSLKCTGILYKVPWNSPISHFLRLSCCLISSLAFFSSSLCFSVSLIYCYFFSASPQFGKSETETGKRLNKAAILLISSNLFLASIKW